MSTVKIVLTYTTDDVVDDVSKGKTNFSIEVDNPDIKNVEQLEMNHFEIIVHMLNYMLKIVEKYVNLRIKFDKRISADINDLIKEIEKGDNSETKLD